MMPSSSSVTLDLAPSTPPVASPVTEQRKQDVTLVNIEYVIVVILVLAHQIAQPHQLITLLLSIMNSPLVIPVMKPLMYLLDNT
jgi:hypothetical protein